MDLRPYYKEISNLLIRCADTVRREVQSKESEIPNTEREIRAYQKELKQNEHNLEMHVLGDDQMEESAKAALLGQAKSIRDEARLKDDEIKQLKSSLTEEIKNLRDLQTKLLQEAKDYDSR